MVALATPSKVYCQIVRIVGPGTRMTPSNHSIWHLYGTIFSWHLSSLVSVVAAFGVLYFAVIFGFRSPGCRAQCTRVPRVPPFALMHCEGGAKGTFVRARGFCASAISSDDLPAQSCLFARTRPIRRQPSSILASSTQAMDNRRCDRAGGMAKNHLPGATRARNASR